MQFVEELDSVTIERLRKQGEFLLRIYQAEIAKNPASRATESSRSNVIAMQQECKNESAALLAVDSNGYTALHRAVCCKDIEEVKELLAAASCLGRLLLAGDLGGRRVLYR